MHRPDTQHEDPPLRHHICLNTIELMNLSILTKMGQTYGKHQKDIKEVKGGRELNQVVLEGQIKYPKCKSC